jgi:hypothetical protein
MEKNGGSLAAELNWGLILEAESGQSLSVAILESFSRVIP